MDDAKQPESSPEPLPPHEIIEEIGRDCAGGSAIYRARDRTRGAVVALQAIGPAFFETPDAAADFLREARAFTGLRLPYVLPVYEAGMYGGRPAFTTKDTLKGSLHERPARFTDVRAAADLAQKLARGVAAAHAHGLLHGCLRPACVHFDENDQPLICYFDLVNGAYPRSGSHIGVPAYMAPEQFADPPGHIEPASDVWALGVILYELLTGQRPFGGTAPNDILEGILRRDLAPPRRLRRDIDPSLEAVVLRCLERQPDDRYGSARALADDLERWLRAAPTVARPQTLTQRILRGLSGRLRGKPP